jgi:hypothetical protein
MTSLHDPLLGLTGQPFPFAGLLGDTLDNDFGHFEALVHVYLSWWICFPSILNPLLMFW